MSSGVGGAGGGGFVIESSLRDAEDARRLCTPTLHELTVSATFTGCGLAAL